MNNGEFIRTPNDLVLEHVIHHNFREIKLHSVKMYIKYIACINFVERNRTHRSEFAMAIFRNGRWCKV